MKIAVIGAGIFGSLISLELSEIAEEVHLIESGNEILDQASRVNQARIHTGMHYPRDLPTAAEALGNYRDFLAEFPAAVVELEQYYAISESGSKTSADEYLSFAQKLGIDFELVSPESLFSDAGISLLVKVPEATFDYEIIRAQLKSRILEKSNITLRLATAVKNVDDSFSTPRINLVSGESENFDLIILSVYGMTQTLGKALFSDMPSIKYQLCQVALGRLEGWSKVGITVMDGPFWSVMPFGKTGFHSLTNVVDTPILESMDSMLDCQIKNGICGVNFINSCDVCPDRPRGRSVEMIRKFQKQVKGGKFEYSHSMYTLKAVPSELDIERAARPTQLFSSESGRIRSVFSGKIGSSIQISRELKLQIGNELGG